MTLAVVVIIDLTIMFVSIWATKRISNSDLTVRAIKLYFDETKS